LNLLDSLVKLIAKKANKVFSLTIIVNIRIGAQMGDSQGGEFV